MSMSKDALEGMATILRENGYKVALKDSETKASDIKIPDVFKLMASNEEFND